VLGEWRVRASTKQVPQLLEWAKRLDGEDRIWAIESAGGLGYLLAQQLLAAGEQMVDPNDARSVAIAALRRFGLTVLVLERNGELRSVREATVVADVEVLLGDLRYAKVAQALARLGHG
jgi:hypothetical protein